MNDDKLVSVIIPMYNAEKYIEKCLISVISQNYSNWEIILVNDGSTDKSASICKKYAETENRIVFIEQENKGLSEARNAGLSKAKGDYICFVGSDDWIDESYLSDMYMVVEKNHVDMVLCGLSFAYDDEIKEYDLHCKEGYLSKENFVHKLATNEIESFAVNKLFKAEVIRDTRFKKGVYFEDVVFLNNIIERINSIYVVNKPLYYYYLRSDSIMHTRTIKRDLDYFDAFYERYNLSFFSENEKSYILKLLLIDYYLIVQSSEDKEHMKYRKYIASTKIKNALKLLSKKRQGSF